MALASAARASLPAFRSLARRVQWSRSAGTLAKDVEDVQDAVALHSAEPAMMYSKSYCPHCRKAKVTLDAAGAHYKFLELDLHQKGGEIQARMTQLTGQRTVPMVFIGGKLIGGGSDVAAAAAKGHLDDLLRSAGAVLERE